MSRQLHPAELWSPLEKGAVQCRLCCHFCRIDDGGRGQCGVRVNQGGALYTLVRSRVAALNVDPVEKKPLYHFLPGTRTLSFGTMGCTMACTFCQNHELSQPPRHGGQIQGQTVTPETLVEAARDAGCASISYTYSEPTVFFELMRDTAQAARGAGLANIMVSNGFMSPECLERLSSLIDAANIDLKGFTDDFYRGVCHARLEPVRRNLKRMREMGWWLELTTLLIPDMNDSPAELEAMAAFIAKELGTDTPWHISRFRPDFQMMDKPPTPLSTLERAWEIGRAAGLAHVYVGNVADTGHNSTMCPGCGRAVIERDGFAVLGGNLENGACAFCGTRLGGVFEPPVPPEK